MTDTTRALLEQARAALHRMETAFDWFVGRSGFTQTEHLKGLEHSSRVRAEVYAAHDAVRAVLAAIDAHLSAQPNPAQPAGESKPRCTGCDIPNGCPEYCRCEPEPLQAAAQPVAWDTITQANQIYAPLVKAVVEFLCAVDEQHATKDAPLKYTVPWGALNTLRSAVGATPPTGEPGAAQPVQDSFASVLTPSDALPTDESSEACDAAYLQYMKNLNGAPRHDWGVFRTGWFWREAMIERRTGESTTPANLGLPGSLYTIGVSAVGDSLGYVVGFDGNLSSTVAVGGVEVAVKQHPYQPGRPLAVAASDRKALDDPKTKKLVIRLMNYGSDFVSHPASRGADDIEEAGNAMLEAADRLAAAPLPAGWRLVPVEPTREMMEAMTNMPALRQEDLPLRRAGWSLHAITNRQRWMTAVVAAPSLPPAEQRKEHQ